nr:upf0653 protein [Quercus suber]
MPHKHVRRKVGSGEDYNLGPTDKAKPLPTFDGSAKKQQKDGGRKQGGKRKHSTTATKDYKENDTPRAFARLMDFKDTGKRRSGLDDGDRRAAKKRKSSQVEETVIRPPVAVAEKVELPKIQPGERLGDYSARVDQALPIAGLARKGKVQIEGVKERTTKTEKRLKKMYASWREEDARRKEAEEEFQEKHEEEEEEREAELGGQAVTFGSKKKRMIGEQADDKEDPWAVLKTMRATPRGLHDVVQAPPEFTVKPREKFKVRNGAKVNVTDVPTASGSLKRREELSDARRDVIQRYRAMMKGGQVSNLHVLAYRSTTTLQPHLLTNHNSPFNLHLHLHGFTFVLVLTTIVANTSFTWAEWSNSLCKMAVVSEEVVKKLLHDVAFAGPQVDGLATAIQDHHYGLENDDESTPVSAENGGEGISATAINSMVVDKYWQRLVEDPDIHIETTEPVSLQREDQEQNVAIDEIPVTSAQTSHERDRLVASTDRIWQAIAGHSEDYKRLPLREFELLVAIAAYGPAGVLQADLAHSTGQDIRSVPKRTDALAKKDHIVKDAVMTKSRLTSLLRHKKFATALNPAVVEPVQHGSWFDQMMSSLEDQPDHRIALLDLHIALGIRSKKTQIRHLRRCVGAVVRTGLVRQLTAMTQPADVPGIEKARRVPKAIRCVEMLRQPTELDRKVWKEANPHNHRTQDAIQKRRKKKEATDIDSANSMDDAFDDVQDEEDGVNDQTQELPKIFPTTISTSAKEVANNGLLPAMPESDQPSHSNFETRQAVKKQPLTRSQTSSQSHIQFSRTSQAALADSVNTHGAAEANPETSIRGNTYEQNQKRTAEKRLNLFQALENGSDHMSGIEDSPTSSSGVKTVATTKDAHARSRVHQSGDTYTTPSDATADPVHSLESNARMLTPESTVSARGGSRNASELPKTATIASRRKAIALSIMRQAGGVFPGNKEMWYAFATRWDLQEAPLKRPNMRTVEYMLKSLENDGSLVSETFAFEHKGRPVIRKVIYLPGTGPASISETKDKIREVHPAHFWPDGVDVQPELREQLVTKSLPKAFSGPIQATETIRAERLIIAAAVRQEKAARGPVPFKIPRRPIGRLSRLLLMKRRHNGSAHSLSRNMQIAYLPSQAAHSVLFPQYYLPVTPLSTSRFSTLGLDAFTENFAKLSFEDKVSAKKQRPRIYKSRKRKATDDTEDNEGGQAVDGKPAAKKQKTWTNPFHDVDRLVTALALVRCVCSGYLQKYTKWPIVAHALSFRYTAHKLQLSWNFQKRTRSTDVLELENALREPLLNAYERGELPKIDYSDLEHTDWPALFNWVEVNIAMPLQVKRSPVEAPKSVEPNMEDSLEKLTKQFNMVEPANVYELERNAFYMHPTSIGRAALIRGYTYTEALQHANPNSTRDDLMLLKSWCRAIVATKDESYDAEAAARKIREFPMSLVKQANDELIKANILRPSKKSRLKPGRGYHFHDSMWKTFKRWPFDDCNHFKYAADFVLTITEEIEDRGHYKLRDSASDAEVMALTNLVAMDCLQVATLLPERNDDIDAPFPKLTAFGYLNNNYDGKKMDRSRLRFPIVYRVGDKWRQLHQLRRIPVPTSPDPFPGEEGCKRLPFWIDIHDNLIDDIWDMTLRSVLHTVVMRPGSTSAMITKAHYGKLWEWEVELVLTWMEKVGVARTWGPGDRVAGVWKGGWRPSSFWFCAFAEDIVTWKAPTTPRVQVPKPPISEVPAPEGSVPEAQESQTPMPGAAEPETPMPDALVPEALATEIPATVIQVPGEAASAPEAVV